MTAHSSNDATPVRASLAELATFFTRLGFTAFGGPAAHIAMMQDELVERRRWVSRQHFSDALAATQLVPGPNSTEMVIHIGYLHQGRRGMLLAGACFILPAFFMVLAISIFYSAFGNLPQVSALFYGIQPVIVAIVILVVYRLALSACRRPLMLAVALVAFLATLVAGAGTVWVILGGGLISLLSFVGPRLLTGAPMFLLLGSGVILQQTTNIEPTLWRLFLFFLKVGGTAMGSGYVIASYLSHDLVQRYGWLSNQQLVDAIAVGQMTPGPVYTTAAFAGYIIMAGSQNQIAAGVLGAVVSAFAIFLPSFLIVLLIAPIIPRLRSMMSLAAFLDGVNAAVVGSIAATCWTLFLASAVDLAAPVIPLTVGAITVDLLALLLLVLAIGVMLAFPKLNSTWLILVGALVGFVAQALSSA